MATSSIQKYPLGDWQLQSGHILPNAHLAYKTYGSPSSPCIVYPTWYSGTIVEGNEWLIDLPSHPRKALDPEKYFIVIVALFGNGESTSPSNSELGVDLPKATMYDNVRAQHKLITEGLDVQRVRLVVGWSMGAGQSYQWASQYPDFVDLCAPFCGSARTSLHNQLFLESFCFALKSDPAWKDGRYTSQPTRGLKALGHIYSGWGFSQAFLREKGHTKYYGCSTVQEWLESFWEAWACSKDANNMLYLAWTWLHADISAQPLYAGESQLDTPTAQGGRLGKRGDLVGETTSEDDAAFKRALQGIKAKTLVMPARSDLYFPPEDSEIEVEIMGKEKSTLKVIETIWGHWAGGPGDAKEDAAFIDEEVYKLLESYGGDGGKMASVAGGGLTEMVNKLAVA